MVRSIQVRVAQAADAGNVSRIARDNPGRHFEGTEFWVQATIVTPELSLVLEDHGKVVGWTMAYPDSPLSGDARKLRFNLMVDSEVQGRGLGNTLLQALGEAARTLEVQQLRAMAWTGEMNALSFLRRHGFEEHHRMTFSRVNVAQVDLDRLEASLTKVSMRGVTVHSYLLPGLTDEGLWEELTPVHNAVMASMPPYFDDPPVSSTTHELEDFVNASQYPDLPGILFIGRDAGGVVAYATAYRDADRIHQGLTGVHPFFRRMGLALALKALVFQYAQSQDVAVVDTGYQSNNVPIAELNRSLGFELEKAELRLWKKLA